MVTLRLRDPVKIRRRSRKALENARDLRVTRLVNPRRSAGRADKVDKMSRGHTMSAGQHAP